MMPPPLSTDLNDWIASRSPLGTPLPIEELRSIAAAEVAETSRPPCASVRTVDLTIDVRTDARELAARLYSVGTHAANTPVTIWFHGGGFILGGVDTSDALCRELSAASGTSLLSVEYRLSPEHRWPAQRVDCQAVYHAVSAGAVAELGTPPTVALAGDSAGGHLAASIARDAEQPPAGRLLFYPVATNRRDTRSYRDFAQGYGLTADDMEHACDLTFAQGDSGFELRPPDSSPSETYYVITAECDVLRDEAEDYAHALRDAGATVTAERFTGMPHGFVQMAALTPIANVAIVRAANFLAAVHRSSGAHAIPI